MYSVALKAAIIRLPERCCGSQLEVMLSGQVPFLNSFLPRRIPPSVIMLLKPYKSNRTEE